MESFWVGRWYFQVVVVQRPTANGNVTGITPPGKPEHAFGYNDVELLYHYFPPELAGVPRVDTFYYYDRDRNLTMVSRPDSRAVSLGYDQASGRLTQLLLSSVGEILLQYHDGSTGIGNTGQLHRITRPEGGTVEFLPDGFLPGYEAWDHWPVWIGVFRQYDDDLNLKELLVGSPPGVNYHITLAYDDDGLLTAVSLPDQGLSLDLRRDTASGYLLGTDAHSGGSDTLRTNQWYNGFGELAGLEALVETTGEQLYRVIYDDGDQHPRDALGRIVRKQETVLGESHEFTYHYDVYGRLEDVCRDGEHYSHYEYDDNGNRLLYQKCAAGVSCRPGQRCPAEIERSGVHDEQDRLLGYGDASFAYTANGELYEKIDEQGITTYGYDELGNLLDVWLPDGGRVHYLVDGRNRRIGRQVFSPGGTLTAEQGFIYLDQLNPVAELDGEGNIVSVFVYATRPNVPDLMYSCKDPAAPVAPCAPGAPWRAYRVVSDHLGSVRLVVSLDDGAFGEVVQRMDYDEYGVVLTDTAPGFQPFGFVGGGSDRNLEVGQ